MELNRLTQEFHVNRSFSVIGQNELTSIAALRDVMRNANCDYPCQSSHATFKLAENVPSVPGFLPWALPAPRSAPWRAAKRKGQVLKAAV
jgi:hypothetical protein